MKPVWNDTDDAPLASDGRSVVVGHIGTRVQAERWQARGYDIAQAADRYRAFLLRWEDARTEAAADAIVDAFYAAEVDYLRTLGIDESDADFHRMLSAAKYHEWA